MNHVKYALQSLASELSEINTRKRALEGAIAILKAGAVGPIETTKPEPVKPSKKQSKRAFPSVNGLSAGLTEAVREFVRCIPPGEEFTTKQVREGIDQKYLPVSRMITNAVKQAGGVEFITSTRGAGGYATYRKSVPMFKPSNDLVLA